MSDNVKIALIVSTGPTLIGLLTAFLGYVNNKRLKDVHRITNSLMDQRIIAEKIASHSQGMADQRAQTKRDSETNGSGV